MTVCVQFVLENLSKLGLFLFLSTSWSLSDQKKEESSVRLLTSMEYSVKNHFVSNFKFRLREGEKTFSF